MSPSGVEAAYDAWAASYDDDANATRDLDAAVLRGQGPSPAGLDVVEFGCGSGKNTAWLARTARSLVGLDLSEAMLAKARARVSQARFVKHDVSQAWPLADHAADLVVGDLVLEHVRDLHAVFAEAARILRPGGRLYMCELHPFRQLRGGQANFTGPGGEQVFVEAHVHSVSDYVNAGLAAGLTLERLGEWRDPGADSAAAPRLLSALFRKP